MANSRLFASRTAGLSWTIASSISHLLRRAKLNRSGRALFPSAWKYYRPALILLWVSSPYRLARSAIAQMPNGFATASVRPIRRFSFSNMILLTVFSIACAPAKFPARTRPDNSANNSATVKDSRRWFSGWTKARLWEGADERQLPILQNLGEADPSEDRV